MSTKDATTEEQNTALIAELFKLRRDGLVHEVQDLLAQDIEWQCNAPTSVLAFAGHRTGRAAVLDYFEQLDATWTLERYDITELIAQGDRVVALGNIAFRNSATRKLLETRKADVFRIRDGQVASFEEFFDSAATVDCCS